MKLSHSQIASYSSCGKKYEFRYVKRIRSNVGHGALFFGSAIDAGLNHLLKTKDLAGAKDMFIKSFTAQNINDEYTLLPRAENLVYSKKDFDHELLVEHDEQMFAATQKEYNLHIGLSVKQTVDLLKDLKSESGLNKMTSEEKKLLNYGHWLCLKRKGLLMLEAYYKKVMPEILEVLAVQKSFSIKNSDGDTIMGFGDLIAKMRDGKTYVLDNKTSTRPYESDSAGKSQQLILYKHAFKEYKPDGVGFIVMYKQIKKNKVKICGVCGHDGSEGRHQTCPVEVDGEVVGKKPKKNRCGGQWKETISPECDIDIILNEVSDYATKLVLETAKKTNEGIKAGVFVPNLASCGTYGGDFVCEFYKLCWEGKKDDVVELGAKKELDETGWT